MNAKIASSFTTKTGAAVAVALLVICMVVVVLVNACVILSASPAFATASDAVRVMINQSKINLVAVDTAGEGVMTSLDVTIQDGQGRVLVAAEPLIGIDTQTSEKTAVSVAERLLGVNLSGKDVIFTINASAPLVDGPSAGAAMTVAVFSAMTGNTPNPDMIITGTIEDDGTVGMVGKIMQKAKAVADYGFSTMLIPQGGSIQASDIGELGSNNATTEQLVLNVSEYAHKNWNLTLVEVGNISEVLELMLGDEGLNLSKPQNLLANAEHVEVLELPNLNDSVNWVKEKSIAGLSKKMLARANATLENVSRALPLQNTSTLKADLDEAYSLFGKGYFYSAANEAFLTAVSAKESYVDEKVLLSEIERLKNETYWIKNFDHYTSSNIQAVAAAQQRLLWAEVYSNQSANATVPEELAAASEWLAACKDIISESQLAQNATSDELASGTISASTIDATARKEVEDAYSEVKIASLLGGVHARMAQRSLYFALKSLDEGLPAAAVYNAIDAKAYAATATSAGTLGKTLEKAELVRESVTVESPWAVSYMRHSLYLDRKAREEQSLEGAKDSLYMAVRAMLVEQVFSERGENAWEQSNAITDETVKKYLDPLKELGKSCNIVISKPGSESLLHNPLVIASVVLLSGCIVLLTFENAALRFPKKQEPEKNKGLLAVTAKAQQSKRSISRSKSRSRRHVHKR